MHAWSCRRSLRGGPLRFLLVGGGVRWVGGDAVEVLPWGRVSAWVYQRMMDYLRGWEGGPCPRLGWISFCRPLGLWDQAVGGRDFTYSSKDILWFRLCCCCLLPLICGLVFGADPSGFDTAVSSHFLHRLSRRVHPVACSRRGCLLSLPSCPRGMQYSALVA